MKRGGVASLPLHSGKAPRWLFHRMTSLAQGIVEIIIYEYKPTEIIRRLSDPFWFQAFSCVLGFDWHSSGTTTVTCGALKEALSPRDHGLAIAGGKGKASRDTLREIEECGKVLCLTDNQIESLKYSSRMTAKVDSAALQDNHQLYHHNIIFTEKGEWTVIQQGMNLDTKRARRYHWLSETIKDYVEEPHEAILGYRGYALDMTAKESREAKKTSLDLVNDHPRHLKGDWERVSLPPLQTTLFDFKQLKYKQNFLKMPKTLNWPLIREIYEFQPKNYEQLLSFDGVGPATTRALALISDLIYGCPPSWKDPIKYTFTVGGKDGVPYPVDKKTMDSSIDFLKKGIQEANVGKTDKLMALQRLNQFIPPGIKSI